MKEGGNGGPKAKTINTVQYNNLVLVYMPGLQWPYIGLKFGRELRNPFVFIFGDKAADPSGPKPPPGVISFGLIPIPFLDKPCLYFEGGFFWHEVTNGDVQKTFHNLISPIKMP